MNVYLDIVNAIYTKTTDIDGTHFSDPFEFLEIKHSAAKFKGKVFYENMISALVKHWGATIKKRAGENFSDDCISLVNYCKGKIAEYDRIKSLDNEIQREFKESEKETIKPGINKKAPQIIVDEQMYSTKFYSDVRTNDYDIVLPEKYGLEITAIPIL